ncbi:MAG: mechanosensitive ion channel family protein [Woeseiaceae bacterium]|nr:mechanosensitive ion channel family protein [Woeseiaceae bacterium]
MDSLTEYATGLWDRLTSIDPQTLITSGLLSLAIIVGSLLLRWLLLTVLRKFYARLTRDAEMGAGGDADSPEANRRQDDKHALPATIPRLLNLVIGVLALAFIAETWGAGLGGMLSTGIGARIAEMTFAIVLILVATVILWNASELVVTRLLRMATHKLDRDRTARRLDSLVPLLSSILQGVIGVLAGLLMLSELGINIGPLLAGAGILGLAIGFGAQTLVKDLITGVTILLEDGATIGDYVEIGNHGGTVEEMRIRIIQLRDVAGVVHLIPYSDVTSIKNYTKDFSYYLFNIGIAYRENTDHVCKVLMEVSEALCADETFGADIMQPLEILGVDKFADSAVVIKARIKTEPGRQWAVGREFNRRMKARFDEEGIEIPFPHSTVYFGEPKEGKAPPMRVEVEGGGGSLLGQDERENS